MSALTWRERGRCTGAEPALFYPEDDEDPGEAAEAACETCRVREACLEYAAAAREKVGARGGVVRAGPLAGGGTARYAGGVGLGTVATARVGAGFARGTVALVRPLTTTGAAGTVDGEVVRTRVVDPSWRAANGMAPPET